MCLAILTQSFSMFGLIVDNPHDVGTFFYILILFTPQLISLIMPIALFIAVLYNFHRLNMDRETLVATVGGLSPTGQFRPVMHIAAYALILHLFINLYLQPLTFRERRIALFEMRTNIAAQLVQAGQFATPVNGITFFAQSISSQGLMQHIIIDDVRNPQDIHTYIAESGYILRQGPHAQLVLNDLVLQKTDNTSEIHHLSLSRYALDLSEMLTLNSIFHLKASDYYLHELFQVHKRADIPFKHRGIYYAEAHRRLSNPFYNPALALLAFLFMTQGKYQHSAYGQRMALCVGVALLVYVCGFTVTALSETYPMANIFQYALPIGLTGLGGWLLFHTPSNKALHADL